MISIYDVLKASKGIHVDDTFAELWGRKLSNAYTVATYTGTLPTTLRTVEGYLESYKIYGNTVQDGTPTPENPIVPSGCGVRTENLFDGEMESGYYDNNGEKQINNYWIRCKNLISTNSNTVYHAIIDDPEGVSGSVVFARCYDSRGEFIGTARQTVIQYYKEYAFTTLDNTEFISFYVSKVYRNAKFAIYQTTVSHKPYIPYGYKLPLAVNGVEYPIYIGNEQLAKDEYVDSATGKIYRRTKNLSPPEEEWVDGQIWGSDGAVHPSTQIKTSPFIDVSTCETCIMEVFSAETEWAEAGYRDVAFYDANKQYLGWIGGGGRRVLTPNSSERLSEFPAGTVYVRIGCSHGDQPFYPQLVSGYTPTHQFYPYLVPTDPPAPFPQIPTFAGTTAISWAGEGLAPSEVELTYRKRKGQ